MQSNRVRPGQLPFWPVLQKTARIAKSPLVAKTVAKTVAKSTKATICGAETPAERAVRMRLQERMSARVGLKNKQGRGSFTVHFTSYAELDEIMRRIDA